MRKFLRFNNLRFLIRDLELTLSEVAVCCGVSVSALSRYCDGTNIPRVDVALRLSEYLDVSFYDIWGKPYREVKKHFACSDRGKIVEDKYVNNLEEYRNVRGFSVEYLAHRCGIPLRTIRRYLLGSTIPNCSDALYLSNVLGATVYDLFEEDG